jgi:hypothetical protein
VFRTSGDRFRFSIDFYKAEPAGSKLAFIILDITQVWYINPIVQRCLQQIRIASGFYLTAIYYYSASHIANNTKNKGQVTSM